jgi:hypothetical protein
LGRFQTPPGIEWQNHGGRDGLQNLSSPDAEKRDVEHDAPGMVVPINPPFEGLRPR